MRGFPPAGAPASADVARTDALLGPGPTCVSPKPNGGKSGRVVLQAGNFTDAGGFRTVNVGVSVNGLAAGETYRVWLTDVDAVVGCSALSAGRFSTNGAGSGRFNGAGYGYGGPHNYQVYVVPEGQSPFVTNSAYSTGTIALNL